MTTMRIAMLPRDGFFCKDGRGWFTSASGRGHGLEWPWPSTILGTVRTAWGRGEEDRTGTRFEAQDWLRHTKPIQLSRIVALRRPLGAAWCAGHLTWPVPLDAIWFEGDQGIQRLEPEKPELPTLGRDDDTARQALYIPSLKRNDKPGRLPAWWPHADMVTWLAGGTVPAPGAHALALARRFQAHVGIRPDELTADEGVLFSHDVVETLEAGAEWAIGAEVCLPTSEQPAMATIGSDSRPVRIESLPENLFDPPADLLTAFRAGRRGIRAVLVTPACFKRGWLPDGIEEKDNQYRGVLAGLGEVILRAAFVPRPMHISGWDVAKGAPKPTARMAAPGAVYFFERVNQGEFQEADARSLWLAGIGDRTEEGFGRMVPGVWNPTRSIR